MSQIQMLANNWLLGHSFSIGIADCCPSAAHATASRATILAEVEACGGPWLDEDTKSDRLNSLRDSAAGAIVAASETNAFGLMMNAGSKGSKINISQVSVCLGQQMAGGKRVAADLERGLPHFCRGCSSAEAKGFVVNNYTTGLTPQEFWAHTTAGREGREWGPAH